MGMVEGGGLADEFSYITVVTGDTFRVVGSLQYVAERATGVGWITFRLHDGGTVWLKREMVVSIS